MLSFLQQVERNQSSSLGSPGSLSFSRRRRARRLHRPPGGRGEKVWLDEAGGFAGSRSPRASQLGKELSVKRISSPHPSDPPLILAKQICRSFSELGSRENWAGREAGGARSSPGPAGKQALCKLLACARRPHSWIPGGRRHANDPQGVSPISGRGGEGLTQSAPRGAVSMQIFYSAAGENPAGRRRGWRPRAPSRAEPLGWMVGWMDGWWGWGKRGRAPRAS